MASSELTPVVTQRVRAFLAGQGVDLRPWSGLDETYARLYDLLSERRNDPRFWEALETLLGRIALDAAEGERHRAAPGAELLASWDMAVLVRDLRAALPGAGIGAARPSLRAFTAALSAPVLGGFLLVGLAASGCVDGDDGDDADAATDTDSDSDSDSDSGSDTDSGTDTDWDSDCALSGSSPIYQAIADSSLATDDKRALCTCLAALVDDWQAGLTDLFQNGTPQEIAAALEDLVQCCDDDPGALDGQFNQDVADLLVAGDLCDVPIYKGVAFPSR
jgi:hypothetical protein